MSRLTLLTWLAPVVARLQDRDKILFNISKEQNDSLKSVFFGVYVHVSFPLATVCTLDRTNLLSIFPFDGVLFWGCWWSGESEGGWGGCDI